MLNATGMREVVGITVRNGTSHGLELNGGRCRLRFIVSENNLNCGFVFRNGNGDGYKLEDSVSRFNKYDGVNKVNGVILVNRVIVNNNGGYGVVCAGVPGGDCVADSLLYKNQFGISFNTLGKAYVIGCTILSNLEDGVWLSGGPDAGPYCVLNSIIWSNVSGIRAPGGMPIQVDYNLIQGGRSSVTAPYDRLVNYGSNNIVADPRFISPSTGNYRLRDDSPAIGTGGPVPIGITGIRSAEPLGSALDIGAFENSRAYPAVTNFAVFGVLTHNQCAGDQAGAIRLYAANGVEPWATCGQDPIISAVPAKI